MPNHLDALSDYQLSCSNADSLNLNQGILPCLFIEWGLQYPR